MKILVIGSGGREHAICRSFALSEKVSKIYCAAGNAGIAELAECVSIKPSEIIKLADFAAENHIDLTFVGGETALALGIVDEFERRGLKIVGASEKAARLEASKSFAKDFMRRYAIPTAEYAVASTAAEAVGILRSGKFGDENAPVVVKADGLAAGKGVVVAENRGQAETAIREMENLVGVQATEKIVLEEFLAGREVSLLMFADGENFALMPSVRDHKRIGDDNTGANTGGMGTFTDADLLTESAIREIIDAIVKPTLAGCRTEDYPFRGILFVGLMLTANGVKVLEYNVRFGDPETQSLLARLETDLTEICAAMIDGKLKNLKINWRTGSSACIILAAENYPAQPTIGDVIHGLNGEFPDALIFHGGTKRDANGDFITAGGRVLGITATGENTNEAVEKAYRAAEKISWRGMQYRKDIGR